MNRREFMFLTGGAFGGVLLGVAGARYEALAKFVRGREAPVATAQPRPAEGLLPAGSRVLFIGDSIFASNNTATYNGRFESLSHNANGEIVWAWMQDPRFHLDVWNVPEGRVTNPDYKFDGANQGVNGSRVTRLADEKEIAHIRELDPDLVIVGFGANDIPSKTSAGTFTSYVKAFCDMMVNVDGRRVVVGTVRPHVRSGAGQDNYNYPEGDPRWAVHFAINDFITKQLPLLYKPGQVKAWDSFSALADPNSYRGGEFLPGLHRDGVHLTDVAAYRSGRNLMPVLGSMIQPGLFFDVDPAASNLLPNGTLEGGGGKIQGPVIGSLPYGCSLSRTAGDGGVAKISREHDPEFGRDKLVISLSSNAGAAPQEFRLLFHDDVSISIDDAGGRDVQLFVPVEIDSYSGFIGVTSFIADDQYEHFTEGLRPYDKSKPVWHGEAISAWVITPALRLPEGAKGIRAGISIRFAAGEGSSVVKIRPNVIARVVANPRLTVQS
ncbi:SGNH/GDSL hydrolase family protein [Kaistia dalseonensis]|uniref:Lysophospholipase L1-like esterase n=1 Tax=Kaistia dalseonensis TaxID=410840 RepID=A0ABU0H200_9HYPH|nr:SGNH/GDSL hydrolase family protein [Kaistia dalseonensis]MCX5493775.1 SGNH/GDSL hydrolase family protein [Kaistia dalseonensis]MDQ0436339.1 lysophospholipase L1-like esterase [Kaistia dalseonensis]